MASLMYLLTSLASSNVCGTPYSSKGYEMRQTATAFDQPSRLLQSHMCMAERCLKAFNVEQPRRSPPRAMNKGVRPGSLTGGNP
jgi:hypothetical protein